MNEAELIFTALAELSTRQIAETMNAVGMDENKVAGKKAAALLRRQGVNWKQRQAKGCHRRELPSAVFKKELPKK